MSHKFQVIAIDRPADWTPPHNSILPESMIYCRNLRESHAIELARRLNADELAAPRGQWFLPTRLVASKTQASRPTFVCTQTGISEAADRGGFDQLFAVVERTPERHAPQVVYVGPRQEASVLIKFGRVMLPIDWDFAKVEGGAV